MKLISLKYPLYVMINIKSVSILAKENLSNEKKIGSQQ